MFRLAQDLGMTVGELLKRMSSSELTEWQAFYMIQHKAMNPTEGMTPDQVDLVKAFS